MNGKQLKNSILQWAIQGKLVPQDPNDEPASVLLERIRVEKAKFVKEKKIKKDKNESIIYRGDDNSYYEKFLATGEVKCIDDEIPFEIPKGWEWCRLGEISTYAQTKRKINASKADPQLWELDLEDIEKGGKLLSIKCVGDRKAIGDKTIFDCGDILYSKLRPYLLKILIAPQAGICTPEIIPFSCYGNICKDYIIAFLKTPYVDDYINSVTFGVKMPRVGTETMTSLLVPLPPITEQHRIAAKIQRIIPVIDRYEKAQETLDKLNKGIFDRLKKSILQEAIQGWPNCSSVSVACQQSTDEPASILLEQIRKEKLLLVKEGKLKKSALTDSVIFKGDDNKYWEKKVTTCECIDEDIPFDVPESWAWVRLETILNTGSARRVHAKDWRQAGIPFYRAREIGKLADDGFVDNELYIDISLYEDFSSSGVPLPNDLMITAVGTLGKVYIVKESDKFYYKDGSVLCLANKYGLCAEYLKMVIESPFFKGQYRQESQGTTVATLTMVRLQKYFIPIPPLQEQYRIVETYRNIASIMSR